MVLLINIRAMRTIGFIIRQIRLRKGYSQEYIAFQLGISQKTFSRIEQDGDAIALDKLKKIADLFEIDLHEMLFACHPGHPGANKVCSNSSTASGPSSPLCPQDDCPFKELIGRISTDVEILKKRFG